MKFTDTLHYSDAIAQLVKRNMDLIAVAKTECRELSEDESKEFDENEAEVKELEAEKKELEAELEKESEDKKSEEKQRNNKNIYVNKMEKRSLVKEIRNAMNTGAQINVRAYSVTDEGADVVETDLLNIWEPLRANSVFGKIGAKMYGNLKGDCQIPVMSAGNVGWASELGAAQDGSGAFTSVTLKPKRLTCKVPISLQLLAQDSIDVESAIRADIIAAVQDKFEATVFGTAAGDTTKPAGLFNGYVDDSTKIETFADIADLEADIEEGNFGAIKYVMSPKAKAALRTMIKGTNATGMVYENNAVDGVEAFTTTNVPAGKLIAGDFSQLVIGEWADMTLDVCRDSASLANGCVTLVLNMFVDAELVREGAVAPANI